MSQKGFIPIIVLVVALIGLGAGTVFLQQKTNLLSQAFTSKETEQPVNLSQITITPTPKMMNVFDYIRQRGSVTTTTPTPILTIKPSPTLFPTLSQTIPQKKGNIKGTIVGGYYSRPLSGASVIAKGVISKSVTTDSSGNFTLGDLPVGKYTLSFSHADYTNFADWKDFEVKEGDNVLNRTPNGFLKDFKPTTIKGMVFGDHNGNGQKDSGDEGVDAMFRVENEAGDNYWSVNQYVTADKNGNFSFTLDVGSKYRIVPTEYTFYKKPGSVEFVVDGYGGTKEYNFAYYPTASQAELILLVFNDKNENGIADPDEENIDFNYAEVTNITTGKSDKTWVSSQISSGRNPVYDYGVYKIKLVAGDDSWAYYYKITKAEDIVTIGIDTGNQTVRLGAHKLY